MIVHVGSTNDTKINAVKNVFAQSRIFQKASIFGVDAGVEEFGHPKTLEDTITGAKQRAFNVYDGSDYSVGIESGMFPSDDARSGFFETTVCAIYDGREYSIGFSPAFEWPKKVIELILQGMDGSQAFKEAGLTTHEKIGTVEGSIYILTEGKINRTKLNELGIMMALLQLENQDSYTT